MSKLVYGPAENSLASVYYRGWKRRNIDGVREMLRFQAKGAARRVGCPVFSGAFFGKVICCVELKSLTIRENVYLDLAVRRTYPSRMINGKMVFVILGRTQGAVFSQDIIMIIPFCKEEFLVIGMNVLTDAFFCGKIEWCLSGIQDRSVRDRCCAARRYCI